ncbi:hypothetical protein FQN57_000567 [Myotisia sp. PD_48]|nr:hypothetical protein FQN57_000567 [Myotisia sp. PD_48]
MGSPIILDSRACTPDDEMAARCKYCGKFCNKRGIHAKSGLCFGCKKQLLPEGKGEDASDSESVSSTPSVQAHGNTAEAEDDARSVLSGAEDDVRSINLKSEHDGIHPGHSDAGDDACSVHSEDASDKYTKVCARCWDAEATTTLYNTPVCEDCLEVAQANRVSKDSAMHRVFKKYSLMIPLQKFHWVHKGYKTDAHRRKRIKKPKNDQDNQKGKAKMPTQHREESQEMESVEMQELKNANQRLPEELQKSMKTFSELLDEVDRLTALYEQDGNSAQETFELSVKLSVHHVFRRKLQELEEIANKKLDEATEAVDEWERWMENWRATARKA